jgi:acyl-CoA dehydrogenase
MDFELSADHQMLREMLRRFVEKDLLPLEMGFYTRGHLLPEERSRVRGAVEQMGLWGAGVPEKHGGPGLDTLSLCLIERELGRTFVPVELGDVPPALLACAGGQVPAYLEPALAGQRRAILAVREPGSPDPRAWTTTADRDGEIVLRGRKWIGFEPEERDFFLVFARHPMGPTAFLLDAGLDGLRVTGGDPPALELQGVRVPEESILGEPGGALRLGAEAAPRGAIRLGARATGITERLAEMAAEHAKTWVSLGASLAVRPAIQSMLAEMRTELEAARWLVLHAAWLADRGEDVRLPAARVRLFTTRMLQQAIRCTTLAFAGPAPEPEEGFVRQARAMVPREALALAQFHMQAALAAELS